MGPPCYMLEGQWAYLEEEVIEWVRTNRITFCVPINTLKGRRSVSIYRREVSPFYLDFEWNGSRYRGSTKQKRSKKRGSLKRC
jgi:hypothetical protein